MVRLMLSAPSSLAGLPETDDVFVCRDGGSRYHASFNCTWYPTSGKEAVPPHIAFTLAKPAQPSCDDRGAVLEEFGVYFAMGPGPFETTARVGGSGDRPLTMHLAGNKLEEAGQTFVAGLKVSWLEYTVT